ncbi:hypothetical protein AB0B20_22620 [Micromonospora sp. NPDC049151]|uniref:hypothetical protein n=1 Tax=Micromonospora sp. NPDC049151 TaxID=3155648 RepID=UPI0033FCDC81
MGSILTDADAAILELDGSEPFVAVMLTPEKARQLQAGQAASALDETSGTRVKLEVATVASKASIDSGTGTSGVAVTLRFKGRPLAVNDRSLLIEIPSSQGNSPVLAVPVTAVYSRPDGTSFVTTVLGDGSTSDVTVSANQAVGGWVEVKNDVSGALGEGSIVVVGLR